MSFDQVIADVCSLTVYLDCGTCSDVLSVTAVYTSGMWSGKYFIFAALNLKTVLLLLLKHFDIASHKCFVDWKSACLSSWTSCVFCWTYNPILYIKQRTDISLVFLLVHRRKDINCHRHINL